jgi:hypothetical protein
MLQNIDACAGERVSGRSAEDATAGARAAAAIGEGEEAIEAVAGDGGLRWARGRQTYRCRCNACESAGGGIDAGDGAGVARSEEGRGYKSARTGRRGNSVQFTLATVWGKRDVARYAQAESPKSCCTNFGSQEGDCFPFMIYPSSPQPSSSPSAGDRCRAVKRRVCCCAELFQEKSHECTVCRHAVTPRFSLLTTIDLSGCKANTVPFADTRPCIRARCGWPHSCAPLPICTEAIILRRRESDALATIVRAQLWPCTNISMVTQAPDRSWCSIQRAELHSPPTVASMSGTAKQPRCTPLQQKCCRCTVSVCHSGIRRQSEVGPSQQSNNHAYR